MCRDRFGRKIAKIIGGTYFYSPIEELGYVFFFEEYLPKKYNTYLCKLDKKKYKRKRIKYYLKKFNEILSSVN